MDEKDESILAVIDPKVQNLCDIYLTCLDWGRAFREAGFTDKTGKEAENLFYLWRQKHPEVTEYIREVGSARSVRMAGLADRLVLKLSEIAFGPDMRAVIEWDDNGVSVFPSNTLSDEAAQMVKNVSMTEGKNGKQVKVEMIDRLQAISLMMKALGMEKTEITNNTVNISAEAESRNKVAEFFEAEAQRRIEAYEDLEIERIRALNAAERVAGEPEGEPLTDGSE